MKSRVVLFCRKICVFLVCVLIVSCVSTGFCFNCGEITLSRFSINSTVAFPKIFDFFKNFFRSPFKDYDDTEDPEEYVYLGGYPIGLAMESNGVIVIAKGVVTTALGDKSTTDKSDICPGDIIVMLGQTQITCAYDIAMFLADAYIPETTLDVLLVRNNSKMQTTIRPALDKETNKYKLGLWVRDSASGVGTLTFIKENGEFSALGHQITDVDTNVKVDIKNGSIYKCNIVGVQKGMAGAPGELRGLFIRNSKPVGMLSKNTEYGVKGEMNKDYINKLNTQKIKVARKGKVKPGKAQIVSTIDGVVPESFDIEIVKTSIQNNPDKKSMIIHITDKALIEKTGGIVQGMSGSPIVQNNQIVGAVTHVFVNDPTRGYGLYMDWMLD